MREPILPAARVIGLTGQIAAGKTTVAKAIRDVVQSADQSVLVLNADEFARDALADPSVVAAIAEHFGEGVLRDGAVDRPALAGAVFGGGGNHQHREYLESLIHPIVRRGMRHRWCQHAASVVVLDVPLLFRSGWHFASDEIWCVVADDASRNRRAAERGWPPDELRRRADNQTPTAWKRQWSDRVVDNGDGVTDLKADVADWLGLA